MSSSVRQAAALQPKRFTRGKAIVEFCLTCMGYDHKSPRLKGRNSAANDVKACTSPQCPLYLFRRGREAVGTLAQAEFKENAEQKICKEVY